MLPCTVYYSKKRYFLVESDAKYTKCGLFLTMVEIEIALDSPGKTLAANSTVTGLLPLCLSMNVIKSCTIIVTLSIKSKMLT